MMFITPRVGDLWAPRLELNPRHGPRNKNAPYRVTYVDARAGILDLNRANRSHSLSFRTLQKNYELISRADPEL